MKTELERVRLVFGGTCRFPYLHKITKHHVAVRYPDDHPTMPGSIEKYRLKDGSCIGRDLRYANFHLNTVDLAKWQARAESIA